MDPGPASFANLMTRIAPGATCRLLPSHGEPAVIAHRKAPAHEFVNPGSAHLTVMAVPQYRLSQALFDLGDGWRDHFCADPQPVHLLPPEAPYRWSVNGSSVVVMMALPMSEVGPLLDELDVPDAMHRLWASMERGFAEPLVYETIMRTWAQAQTGEPCPRLLVRSRMACMLHALVLRGRKPDLSGSTRSGLGRAQLNAALELIDSRMAEDLSLDDLAMACGISRFHFIRRFRLSTGQTPYRYLLQRRIEAARTLLTSTQMSVSEVGVQVGFPDPGHFSRTFARLVGNSPQRYRNATR